MSILVRSGKTRFVVIAYMQVYIYPSYACTHIHINRKYTKIIEERIRGRSTIERVKL